jgi:DNA polymerase-3 subunit epsilon
MTWLSTVFGSAAPPKILLTPAQLQAISDWKRAPSSDNALPHSTMRYVVVDVEASGLSLEEDRLISIGAVAVSHNLIDVNDAFEIDLCQEQASSGDDFFSHGITASAPREGMDPAGALIAFLQYLGKSPLIAYNARFSQVMIEKAMLEYLGLKFAQEWIDLAWFMPEIVREHTPVEESLDDWLGYFGIENIQRHNAVSDAYATAQLLQIAIARGVQHGLTAPADFIKAEKARRWKRGAN